MFSFAPLMLFGAFSLVGRAEDPDRQSLLQHDPQSDMIGADTFLRRFSHSEAVGNQRLFISGGEVSYNINNTYRHELLKPMLMLDLPVDWQNSSVMLSAFTQPTSIPLAWSSAIWFDEARDLVYLGFVGEPSGRDPITRQPLPPPSLWSFQPESNGTWREELPANSSVWGGLQRPTRALTSQDPRNGWILNGQDMNYNYLPGLVQFNFETRVFTNLSSAPFWPLLETAFSQYVPFLGAAGAVLAVGGNSTGNRLADISVIPVYDIAGKKWYRQPTTGTPPLNRSSHCLAGIASTRDTYEIFVYGGYGGSAGPITVAYDTIDILTLPAFHWINVPYRPDKVRQGHTCHPVGGSQILSVGGADPNWQGNLSESWKQMETADPFKQGLGVFDLTTLQWLDHYSALVPPYEPSDRVKDFYAENNGAYLSNLDPGIVTLVKNVSSTNRPKEPSTPTTKIGIIAGVSVGGSSAVLLVSALFAYRKRRPRQHPKKPAEESELDGDYFRHDGIWIPELNARVDATELVGESNPDGRPHELHGRHLQELRGAEVPELADDQEIRR